MRLLMAFPASCSDAQWNGEEKCRAGTQARFYPEPAAMLLYFPRGTDLSRFSQDYLNRIARRLNQRPRKTLGFETPADRLQAVLQ
jgi:hypothetical protein